MIFDNEHEHQDLQIKLYNVMKVIIKVSPPNFFGSHLLVSETNNVRSY